MPNVVTLPRGAPALLSLLGQNGQLETLLATIGAAGPPTPQTVAPLQGAIFFDPSNTTGKAANSNPGAITAPLVNWAGLLNVWGTIAPLLNTTTTFNFLSPYPNAAAALADPILFAPFLTGNITATFAASMASTVSGVITAGTVAKNRAAGANSLLQTNLGASGAVRQLLINTTHASHAWAYSSLGANAFEISQPMVLSSPGGTIAPAEVDGWANGDTVSLNTLISLNVVYIDPVNLDSQQAAGINTVEFLNCDFGRFGQTLTTTYVGGAPNDVIFRECSIRSIVAPLGPVSSPSFVNCIWTDSGALVQSPTVNMTINGGFSDSTTLLMNYAAKIDGDHILGASAPTILAGSQIGICFIDGTVGLFPATGPGGAVLFANSGYGAPVLYGRAAKIMKFVRNARAVLTSGTYTAWGTSPTLITGLTMNGATTAQSHTNASPDVINSGITTSVANLDAAAGAAGFGGNAFNLSSGAGISNLNS